MSSSSNNSCISLGQGCSSPTNFPQLIDSASCLCGLLKSASTLPNNGGQEQMWRCIGSASDNLASGGHGKWYNTSLPSQELSGINRPQNWGDNPPDPKQVYVLEDQHGTAFYEEWSHGSSPSLIGADEGCTGKNDTGLSGMYYSNKGKASSSSTASSSATSSATTSASGTASSAPATTTTSATTSATGGSASAPSSSSGPAAPSGTSSAAPRFTLSSALLVGMVLAPLLSFVM